MAAGDTAVLAERESKEEIVSVKLGNLQPGEQATLKAQIVSQVEIVGGHFAFSLPTSFFPDYTKHGMKTAPYPYEFNYEARIVSDGGITQLSIPKNARIVE